MRFKVGPFEYLLVIADRRLYTAEDLEVDGLAISSPRLIIISRAVETFRRREVLRHELEHAWAFHVPAPADEEARAQLAAMIDEQLAQDLAVQGGAEELEKLPAQHVPAIGQPATVRAKTLVIPNAQLPKAEAFGRPDRMVCSNCDAETCVGSIPSGEPSLHDFTGKWRVERWMLCDACGTLTHWYEVSTPDGSPTGEIVAHPRPRMLHGAEASAFMAEKRRAMELIRA